MSLIKKPETVTEWLKLSAAVIGLVGSSGIGGFFTHKSTSQEEHDRLVKMETEYQIFSKQAIEFQKQQEKTNVEIINMLNGN
jgi:hypothetical protein